MKPDADNIPRPYGYIHDLIQLLQQRMKFNYSYIVAPSECSYDDLVESVKNNTYQLVAADLTITSRRKNKIDFSYPIYDNAMRLVVRKGERTEFSLFAFLKPFSWQLWLLIVFIVYVVPALLIILYEFCKEKHNRQDETAIKTGNQCQYHCDTKTTALERGFTFQPTTCFSHFQIITVWLISIILTTLLTSNLIVYFKAQYEQPWLQNIEDLRMCQKVACNRIGVIGGSQHEEYIREEVMNGSTIDFHRLKHTDESYAKLLDYRIDVAIADSSTADYFTQMPGYCKLETAGIPFGKTYFGIAMAKEWPYKQDLDDNIMCLKSTGELDRLLEKWFQQKHCDHENGQLNNDMGHPLTIHETSGLFIIFGGLTVVNFIVFVGRYLYGRYSKTSLEPDVKKIEICVL
jgi:ABC-type amino acid transport substrate-binding protein